MKDKVYERADILYDAMGKQLFSLKSKDCMETIMTFEGEQLDCELERIEYKYYLYLEKLKFVKNIENYGKKKQLQCLKNINKINENNKFSSIQKIGLCASYAVLFDKFPDINDRSYEEIIKLSDYFIDYNPEDYVYNNEIKNMVKRVK